MGGIPNLVYSPGPGLLSLVLGPFGPDLGPDRDLTWDLDLDLSLTISTFLMLYKKALKFAVAVLIIQRLRQINVRIILFVCSEIYTFLSFLVYSQMYKTFVKINLKKSCVRRKLYLCKNNK